MYQLYKKAEKSLENPRGAKLIEEGQNPFLKGPCMLCIAAMDVKAKSVFGLAKHGMMMARLRVRGNANGKFDVKDFPVSFLALKYNSGKENKNEAIRVFADTYFTPLISINGEKLDCEVAMRNVRNVNIMSYCNGTDTVKSIEDFMVEKMRKLGYGEMDIEKIQSQMCMIPIATNKLNGSQKSTCISFGDINDTEVNNNVTEIERDQVVASPIDEALIRYSSNEAAYLIAGDGEHKLKSYQTNGRAMPVCLSSVVSKSLENSIQNANGTKEFMPLSMEDLISEIPEISKKAEQGKTLEELRDELDKSLKYGGARKLSDNDILVSDALEPYCDEIARLQGELVKVKDALKIATGQIRSLEDAIDHNCSDITGKKIRMEALGFHYDSATTEEVNSSPCDREIVDGLSKITQNEISEAIEENGITSGDMESLRRLFKPKDRDIEKKVE